MGEESMKIDEASINHNAVNQITKCVVNVAGYIEEDPQKQRGYERGYMLLALGQIRGVCAMAQAMKEVLEA